MHRLVLVAFSGAFLFANSANPLGAEDASTNKTEYAEFWQQAQALLDKGDSYQLVEFLTKDDDPIAATQKFSDLVGILYMQQKNVPQMVMCGRAGIQFALDRAVKLKTDNPQTAVNLRGLAKTISYNVSVNCWPGWGDEGIVITASDLAAGLDLARLNLRLAGELQRDDFVLGNAQWLVGAHWLAQDKRQPAVESFEKSAHHFRTAGKPDFEWMAKGYIGLANLRDPAHRNTGEQQLKTAQQALAEMKNSEDAQFFNDQLASVRTILMKEK